MTFGTGDITENVRQFIEHIRDASVKLSNSESQLARVVKGECRAVRVNSQQLTLRRQAHQGPYRNDLWAERRDQGRDLGAHTIHTSQHYAFRISAARGAGVGRECPLGRRGMTQKRSLGAAGYCALVLRAT